MLTLPQGTWVEWLATMGEWVYIESSTGDPIRGFVPKSALTSDVVFHLENHPDTSLQRYPLRGTLTITNSGRITLSFTTAACTANGQLAASFALYDVTTGQKIVTASPNGGFVLCESLSLRENPEVTSNILTTLKYGARCTIIGENGSWYNIVYSSKQSPRYSGWAKKDYILVNPEYFTPNGETPVYALPTNNSKRVGLISGETNYPIIGELNGFLAISLRGASGFVEKP